MSTLTFDNLRYLNLLWLVLALAAVGVLGLWRRQVLIRRFADAPLLARLAPGLGWVRPAVRLALATVALVALVAALIGPRWGEQTQLMLRRNIDVFVLLDVSRSMLARDIAPNRLERAKLAIRDDLLPALGGDRIGLITFAGVPALSCPLTTDYGFFRLALADVSTRSVGRGGTLIGDAIRKAGDTFKKEIDSHKIVILITDGEDQTSYPAEAAANLWSDQHVPIIALALGDPEQGARIPLAEERGPEKFLEYGGEVVRSRADFATLEQVAKSSPEGVFVAVGTSNFDLGDIYRRVAGALRAAEQQESKSVQQPARFHVFALAALALLVLDSLLRDGARRTATARPALREAA
jgi:Ca-activated chloride channel homolog